MDISSLDDAVFRRLRPAVVAVLSLAAGVVVPILLFSVVRLVIDHWRLLLSLLAVGALAAAAAGGVVIRRRQIERERQWRLREIAHLDRVDVMTGDEFEELTAELLRRDGFRGVQVVGRAGDRGVDVLATSPGGRRIAVQCKRQKGKVTADRVRNLVGALNVTYPGRLGVLVTNNTFTAQAAEEAAAGGLLLVDRDLLARWMDGDPLPV
ncbi:MULTISPECIES: restriction endonuclease [Thermomonospora]|uniref:Restriction endonuclease n=1 Tax=Thermomonospora curvata (strain ATCC 19995 / DSM 43183 / JCM 3096 / KCTC 9072 / NBRC 15933 / NCIMB 10081 / Henssen B9) TaxID=471852 RepID=D1AA74_THECD|nr:MULTISPECIES: restriction endonuclease [Thermomonospora]ACY97010.1 restriction endonuclease [Thermomonospora curvata DSM 43183]PKK14894.1 MAG: DUF2034 domain-containing protein [Thermomonospora sp. CIF 1]